MKLCRYSIARYGYQLESSHPYTHLHFPFFHPIIKLIIRKTINDKITFEKHTCENIIAVYSERGSGAINTMETETLLKNVKILYVAGRWDPRNHSEGSGTDYEVYNALVRQGANIEITGPFRFNYSIPERLAHRIHSLFFKTRLTKYPIAYFHKSGNEVTRAIKAVNPDVVVSKYSAPLVFAKVDKPLVYVCDSTVKWIKGQWIAFSKIAYTGMSIWENRVVQKCDRIVTFSQANADVLNEEYKIPAERIVVFPIPASIPEEVIPNEINPDRPLHPLKLLLVGRDYVRKGVDKAIDIITQLNEQGIPSELRVVGLDGRNTEFVEFKGLYNKTIPDELAGYVSNYQWANFLLHPALFEAAGIVPGEAAAFGVPTLTNNAGGLATTVKDGVSGLVFPNNSPARTYVEALVRYVNDPDAYKSLVVSTRKRYEDELNWNAAEKVIGQTVKSLLS